eukprot:755278-Hanusia_phi.AAC.6
MNDTECGCAVRRQKTQSSRRAPDMEQQDTAETQLPMDVDEERSALPRTFSVAAAVVVQDSQESELEDESVHQGNLADSSQTSYSSKMSKLLCWMVDHRPHLLTEEYRSTSNQGQAARARIIRELLKRRVRPINFEMFTSEDLKEYILQMMEKQPDLRISSYNGLRSAVRDIFRQFGKLDLHSKLDAELADTCRAVKNTLADQPSSTRTKPGMGKEPMSFSLYRTLCKEMLICNRTEYIFTRTYLILSWNLMCRSGDAERILLHDMAWHDDAMWINFAHCKRDQGENQRAEPRSIFANANNPEICPIFALGLYWLTFKASGSGKLFPGNSQQHRFVDCLQRMMTRPEEPSVLRAGSEASLYQARRRVAAELPRFSVTADDIGTHSFVGRTAAGLPVNSTKFALLPPHFQGERDATIMSAIRTCFPTLPDALQGVAEHCLASVVYHYDHLKQLLDTNHSLWSSTLFQSSMFQVLKRRVHCCCAHESDRYRATGIPPHVSLLLKQDNVCQQQDKICREVSFLRQGYERHFIQQQDLGGQTGAAQYLVISREDLKNMFRDIVNETRRNMNRQNEEQAPSTTVAAILEA